MSDPQAVPPKQQFDYRTRDARRWARIEELCASHGIGIEQLLKDFPAFIRRRELPRFLAHTKLFEHVIDLPGCVVELGVFKGTSLMTWANLMETYCPGDRFRMVYGFDHFGGLSDFAEEDGKQHDERNQGKVEGGSASRRSSAISRSARNPRPPSTGSPCDVTAIILSI